VLALLALPLGTAPGPGPGQSSSCTPGLAIDSTAAQTPGQPVRVSETASHTCPIPEAPPGTGFGGGPPQTQQPPPGKPGDPCTARVLEPTELITPPGGQMEVFWVDPSFPGTGSDTPEPQDIARVLSGIDPRTFVMEAGTTDFLLPFRLDGKWDASGFNCVPRDPKNPQGSFSWICTGATIAFTCLIQQPHPIANGPLPVGAVQGGLVDLRARIAQLIHPGQIASLPAGTNPAVVNTDTCFFIDGADIDGQNPTRPQTFELVLLGPPDPSNRQVYYVFEIRLTPQPVVWTFGDGSGDTAPARPECAQADPTPLAFVHRYVSYSPPDGFPVGAIETYTLHVREFWYDSDGQPHPALDLGDFQPILVDPGPAAGFRKVVLQEEGVPLGR
jgi:hypothetical protein